MKKLKIITPDFLGFGKGFDESLSGFINARFMGFLLALRSELGIAEEDFFNAAEKVLINAEINQE